MYHFDIIVIIQRLSIAGLIKTLALVRLLRLGVSATVCTMRSLFSSARPRRLVTLDRCAQASKTCRISRPRTGSWTRDLRDRAPTGRFRSGSLSSQRKLTLNPAAVGEVAAAGGLVTPTTCYDYREEVPGRAVRPDHRGNRNMCYSF